MIGSSKKYGNKKNLTVSSKCVISITLDSTL